MVIVENGRISTSAPYQIDDEWGTVEESALEGCRAVAGSIVIDGRIESLRAFDNIEWVTGSIRFDEATVDELDGFPRLEEVGGSLWLTQGTVIVDGISGLSSLRRVGELNFRGSAGPVTGLTSLEEVVGGAIFDPCPRDVSGFRSLRTTGNFHLWNSGVEDLSGFDSVEVIRGRLDMLRLSRLREPGFAGLREVETDVFVVANARLTSMESMRSLERVGRNISINNNAQLPSEDARTWANNIEVGGRISICANLGGPDEDPCPEELP